MKRTATAIWIGTIKEGSGQLTTQSTRLNKAPYSFDSRFASVPGTNPEELMAAALAGCFTMKLSLTLSLAGFVSEFLEVQCSVWLEEGEITRSHLILKAKIPEILEEQFQEYSAEAKAGCPVSNAYNLAISLEATLLF